MYEGPLLFKLCIDIRAEILGLAPIGASAGERRGLGMLGFAGPGGSGPAGWTGGDDSLGLCRLFPGTVSEGEAPGAGAPDR